MPGIEQFWPQLPDESLQDTTSFEPVDPESYTEGFKNELQSTVESTLGYKLYGAYTDQKTEESLSSNRILSPEEAKSSDLYRPGIDVSKGISEFRLLRDSQEYDRKQKQDFWISQMPKGISSAALRGAAEIIGSATDPATDIAGTVAPELIGARAAPMIARLSPLGIKLASIGTGMAEGAVISTPQAIANTMEESPGIPNDHKIADAITTIGLGVGLGGVIRGIGGVKEPITKESARIANQTAVNQINAGYMPSVDDIVQQGYKDARSIPNNLYDTNTSNDIVDELNHSISLDSQDSKLRDQIMEDMRPSLEALAAKRIKNPQEKKILTSLYKLRGERNKLYNSDNYNQTFDKIREENPRLKYKQAEKKANKAVDDQAADLNRQISDIEKTLKDNDQYKEANAILSRFDQGVYPGNIDNLLEERASSLSSLQATEAPRERISRLFDEKLDQGLSDIREKQEELSSRLMRDKKVSGNWDQVKTLPDVLSQMLNDANRELDEVVSKDSVDRVKMELPSYIRQAYDTLKKLPEFRTKEDVSALMQTIFTDEERLINTNIRKTKDSLNVSTNNAERYFLENEQKNLEKRLREVKKGKRKLGVMYQAKQTFDALELKKLDILKAKKNNEIYDLMTSGSGKNVTQEQLRSSVDKMNQPENKLALSGGEKTLYDSIAASTPDTIDEPSRLAQEIVNELPEKEKDMVSEFVKQVDEGARTMKSALFNAVKCLGS